MGVGGVSFLSSQVHIHSAFYRWFDELKGRCDGSAKSLRELFESAGGPGASSMKADLALPDYIAHELISHPSCQGVMSTSAARDLLRHKSRIAKEKDVAKKVKDVVEGLISEGVLKEVQAPGAPDGGEAPEVPAAGVAAKAKVSKARPGRKVVYFKKLAWTDIASNPPALAAVQRILCTADDFEAA